MQIQEEHSRIYKQAYSLYTWRQVASMWVVSWHVFFESSHGKAHWFIHGMETQLNTKSHQKHLLWVWKYKYHQKWKLTNTWRFTLAETQFSCEQCGNALRQKLIVCRHKRTLSSLESHTLVLVWNQRFST